MGKTLRNIVLCSMLAAGSLLIGSCKVKIQGNVQNIYNISNSASEKPESKTTQENKITTNNLEDYFLQGNELKSLSLSSEGQNPEIINRDDLYKKGEGYNYPFGDLILRGGVGHYIIPKIEEDSEAKDLYVKVVEFDPKVNKGEYENILGEDNHPIFTKNNIVSVIKGDLKDLSPKQKEAYESILNTYINRVEAMALSSEEEVEQSGLLKNEASLGYAGMEEDMASLADSRSNSASNSTSSSNSTRENATNEPANTIATSGLEKYFFKGEELRFLKISSPYIRGTNEQNPCVIDSRDPSMSEKDRESFETSRVLKEGSGEYVLEVGEYSRPVDLSLEILEFESEADKKNFIEKELGEEDDSYFSKGRILAAITPDMHKIDSDDSSPAKIVAYINLIRNYSKRTGLDMILYKDETKNKELLKRMDKFVEKYYFEKGLPKDYNMSLN